MIFKANKDCTVKLGFQQLQSKEQLGVTNMPVHLMNSEQSGFSEQLCDS